MADTWTLVSGYTQSDYSDTMVFDVDSDTKKLTALTGQTLIAGEKNSQYIKFEMDRYWDGIDISGKTFGIKYALAGDYYGESDAVSAEITEDRLRFGWVVPETACCIAGTLLFILVIQDDNYILKTQIAETPVKKTIDEDSVIPEPTREAWYTAFQAQVEADLEDAQEALEAAQTANASAQTALTEAQSATLAAQLATADAQEALTAARINYGSPLVAQTAAAMTETNRVYVYTGSESGYTAGNWYYYNGSAWVSGGVYNGTGINTDTTLTQSGMAADGKATGDAISQLNADINADINSVKSGLNAVPSIKESDAEDVDLDVTDVQGNVIVRIVDGDIQTKDFNSALDARHWVGKKWTAIGDSLTEVNQRTTKHYHDYIAEATGINVVNLGHSGAGYYARPSDYTFRRRALQVETDSDVVTIFGSGNDVGKIDLGEVTDTEATTLCGCVNITLDNIYATAPLVPLGVVTPTPWYQQSGTKNWTPSNPDNPMELYSNAIVEICRRRSIPCLDLYHCSNLHPDIASFRTSQYSKDEGNGIHPDETGHYLIAARFQAFLDMLLLH